MKRARIVGPLGVLACLFLFVGSLTHAKAGSSRGSRGGGGGGGAEGLEVGAGINSYVGGRTVPGLEISYQMTDQAISWAATGVKSKYYYQSSHLLFWFRTWNAGTMWGGTVSAGFGGGLGYSARGFQDENSTTEEKANDFLLGPAIRVNWSLGPVYVNLSTLFGLRDFQKHILGLNFQDVETLSLGFRF